MDILHVFLYFFSLYCYHDGVIFTSLYSDVCIDIFSTVIGYFTSLIERWCLMGYETLVVCIISYSRWIYLTDVFLLFVPLWFLRQRQNSLLCPWSFLSITCVEFGWSVCFIRHVLGNRPFLHRLLGLIIGLSWCYFICWGYWIRLVVDLSSPPLLPAAGGAVSISRFILISF